jgi:capsular polysaccharide biosynthesis protein
VAEAASKRLADQGIQVPPGSIQSSTASEQVHRVVTIRVTRDNPDEAIAVLAAAIEVLQQDAPAFFGRLGLEQPQVTLFDGPSVSPVPPSLTQRLDLPARLLLALVAGVAICFLLNYLDDSIQGREELEDMGIRVLTEVPRQRRRFRG